MASRLRRALGEGRMVRVFGLGQLCHPKLVELVGLVGGFEAVWLDQEHAGLTVGQIERAALAARAAGLDSFVRLAPTDYATVMRPLLLMPPEKLEMALAATTMPAAPKKEPGADVTAMVPLLVMPPPKLEMATDEPELNPPTMMPAAAVGLPAATEIVPLLLMPPAKLDTVTDPPEPKAFPPTWMPASVAKPDARPLLIMWPFGPVALVYDILDTDGEALPKAVEMFPVLGAIDQEAVDKLIGALTVKSAGSFGPAFTFRTCTSRSNPPIGPDE